ncbi:hypothetical protein C900_02417 [Fulvivirga imtechensis AK7]|uniref:Uncharacterized protein n=1 Tax=Fulvivirga imtechensis AK7 TaxID=1237149 RepID=L8JVH1_9BACT|nr:hypothetical protein C900_02417 [Fulvivirga imtechensis AK7]
MPGYQESMIQLNTIHQHHQRYISLGVQTIVIETPASIPIFLQLQTTCITTDPMLAGIKLQPGGIDQ